MTDRCAASTTRSRTYSHEDSDCQPTAEDLESQALSRERAAERDAEVTRNRYFASDTDEGGQCFRASSDASTYAPMLHDDPHLKDARRTARLDPAIESDSLGNAIVGAIAGGIVSGARVAAASAGAKPLIEHVAARVAPNVGKAVLKHEALTGLVAVGKYMLKTEPEAPASSGATSSEAPPPGRSTSKGTSEIVPEPTQSVAPAYTPLLVGPTASVRSASRWWETA